ncbi:MAG TPA: WYL domain-containing protein [Archangium sp.]
MDKTERLLDLVALFLDAGAPVSWDEIRDAFPDEYAGSAEAAQRKWERDKTELHELGIPLSFVQRVEDVPAGYVIDRNAYYLPEVGFTPEELAVLYAAGSAALASGAFPGRQDLAHALRKVGFFADGPLPTPKVRLELGALTGTKELPARLELLWAAINAKKSVELDYFSPHSRSVTTRKVDPWGLALRRGVWNLVGYCHLRQDLRTFHVHRIRRATMNPKSPKAPDFTVPDDFRLETFVASWPWQHRFHEAMPVSVVLSGELAPLAEQLFGVSANRADGKAEVTVSATDLDGLVTSVLALGSEARVVSPEKAVLRARELAQQVLDAHGGGAS